MEEADDVLDRGPAETYLREKYGIKTKLAQLACRPGGPKMLRRGDNRVAYRRSALDAFAGTFVREVDSTKDEGRPLTAAEVAELARVRSAA